MRGNVTCPNKDHDSMLKWSSMITNLSHGDRRIGYPMIRLSSNFLIVIGVNSYQVLMNSGWNSRCKSVRYEILFIISPRYGIHNLVHVYKIKKFKVRYKNLQKWGACRANNWFVHMYTDYFPVVVCGELKEKRELVSPYGQSFVCLSFCP